MILSLLALAASLGELPQQRLEPGRCQLFLWTRAEPPRRVAMALDRPDQLRVMIDGRPRDLPLLAREGSGVATGFGPRARYGDATLSVSFDIDLVTRPGLIDGAVVRAGVMRLEPAGGPAEVVPVGGLAACGR